MVSKKQYPTINLEATGRQIMKLRKAKGLTVRDVQDYFGFEAPQAIYKWQKGTTLPSVDNLFALSALLEVTVNDILISNNSATDKELKGSDFFTVFSGRNTALSMHRE